MRWPVSSACLDGELYSGEGSEGSEGSDAILMARGQAGSPVVFGGFDVLQVNGRDVMGEPWVDRRKRLEDLFAAGPLDGRVQLVPASDDARRLWAVWVVEWGGEGIVLKERPSTCRPGIRSRAWWKAKHKLTRLGSGKDPDALFYRDRFARPRVPVRERHDTRHAPVAPPHQLGRTVEHLDGQTPPAHEDRVPEKP